MALIVTSRRTRYKEKGRNEQFRHKRARGLVSPPAKQAELGLADLAAECFPSLVCAFVGTEVEEVRSRRRFAQRPHGGAILPDALRWLWRAPEPLPLPLTKDNLKGDNALVSDQLTSLMAALRSQIKNPIGKS